MKIVLRLGGSVLGSPPEVEVLTGYRLVLSRLMAEGHCIALVVGGGVIARRYIEVAGAVGLSHREQDLVAILASRLNARLVAMTLHAPTVPATVGGVLARLKKDHLAVMGGLRPGITTDTVAALVAEAWRSDLMIKGSNQEGIYTADPKSDPSATLLTSVSYRDLARILAGVHKPGIHSILDPVAVQHITKNRLRLVVIDGRRPENVLKAVKGEDVGSTVY